MSLEIIFFEKKTNITLICFFFYFVYLLPGFINERSNNTLSVFEESAIEHILSAKVWLYGFESVLWQKLTDYCLLPVCCSSCNGIKIEYRQLLTLIFRNTANRKPLGHLDDFFWFSLP